MDRKLIIETKLRSLGAPGGKSMRDSTAAVLLVIEDESTLDHVMQLYAAIAQTRGTNPHNTARNIRYTVACCWNRNRPGLTELMGYDPETPPTPATFISALATSTLGDELNEDKQRT